MSSAVVADVNIQNTAITLIRPIWLWSTKIGRIERDHFDQLERSSNHASHHGKDRSWPPAETMAHFGNTSEVDASHKGQGNPLKELSLIIDSVCLCILTRNPITIHRQLKTASRKKLVPGGSYLN